MIRLEQSTGNVEKSQHKHRNSPKKIKNDHQTSGSETFGHHDANIQSLCDWGVGWNESTIHMIEFKKKKTNYIINQHINNT